MLPMRYLFHGHSTTLIQGTEPVNDRYACDTNGSHRTLLVRNR
jgi:hypothetical protein